MSWAMLPNKRYFRPDEVADYFEISVRTVYRMIKDGALIGLKISRYGIRIPRESILELEKEREEKFWNGD